MTLLVAVLAHNEERRIGGCLRTLLAEPGDFPVHVIVNGSSDRTAGIARRHGPRVTVHEYRQGGKSRSWNRFVFGDLAGYADSHIFVDGDAEITPGSIAALVRSLSENPGANAAAGLPMNGRHIEAYQAMLRREHGIFGDLYALRGSFLTRMRDAAIHLPEDLIGDDSLLGTLARTDLAQLENWQNDRVVICEDAGFLVEQVDLAHPRTLRMEYKRLINYSVRHFQNHIIRELMRESGPAALPARLSSLYPQYLDGFRPRTDIPTWWFDRLALKRMQAAIRP